MSEKNNYYSLSGRPYPSALTLKEVDQDHQTGIQYRYEEFPHQIFEPPEGRFLAEVSLRIDNIWKSGLYQFSDRVAEVHASCC